ncbi:MAG: hypothetical protein D6819_05840, partial [Gammaproteobacteria bacterium]
AKARVAVVGGGFGGAIAAKYIKRRDPGIDVTLIERHLHYVTCPQSNIYLAGGRSLKSITFTYDRLRDKYGIKVVFDTVTRVDPVSKKLTLISGGTLDYDFLVLSPGIDFVWGAIEGYDEGASYIMPHAWKAGYQTVLLRRQLEAMKDGGVVIIASPGNPYRCPPGPYERASLIAYYLKRHKPRSKVLILDAKDSFAKQGLFMDAWKRLYPGMIDWVPASDGGEVIGVDTRAMKALTEFDAYRGDVINIIPPHRAGFIAHAAGLTDASGWCPVDQLTFESKVHKDIFVVGDACIAGRMPKSGYAANSQAKVAAAAVVEKANGRFLRPEFVPHYVNTCYSHVAPNYGISVVAIYHYTPDGIRPVKGAGGVSPRDAPLSFREMEALYSQGWYNSITADMFT